MRGGTVNLITVLQTQQTLFTAENTLVQVRLTKLLAASSLFQALGGGWTPDGTLASLQPPEQAARCAMKRSAIRRMLFAAARSGSLAMAGAAPSPRAVRRRANNTPLAFGMNADEASQALGTPLIYVRGRPGDEMFLALPNVKGSALVGSAATGSICSSGAASSRAGRAIGGRTGHVADDGAPMT